MRDRKPYLICLLVLSAMGSSIALAATPFTVVAVPDIQNETQYYPAMLQSQVDWIVNNRATKNIAVVAQQGDLTNNATTTEFATASSKLFQLSTSAPGLPWGVLPGNHDFGNIANYDSAFGPSKFAGQSWYGGSSSHSSYQNFSAGSRDYLLINLEYNPSTAVLNWAQGIINANPGKPTIINTHDYIAYGNTRSSVGNTIWGSALTGNPDGLINGNSQVFMVLCGHNHFAYNQTSTDKAGKPVFECIADYQDTSSGDGYLRLYQFDEDNSTIHATTYSPYDATTPYLTEPLINQFDISMDFNSRLGTVPEPTSLVFIILGACALGSRRRHD